METTARATHGKLKPSTGSGCGRKGVRRGGWQRSGVRTGPLGQNLLLRERHGLFGDRELVPGPTRDTDSSHFLSTGTCSRTSFPASWTLIPHTARRLTGSEGQRGGALGSGSSLCSPQPHQLASPRASHRGWPSRHGPAVQHQVSGPSEPHASYGFTGQPGSGVASFKPLTYGAACDTSV